MDVFSLRSTLLEYMYTYNVHILYYVMSVWGAHIVICNVSMGCLCWRQLLKLLLIYRCYITHDSNGSKRHVPNEYDVSIDHMHRSSRTPLWDHRRTDSCRKWQRCFCPLWVSIRLYTFIYDVPRDHNIPCSKISCVTNIYFYDFSLVRVNNTYKVGKYGELCRYPI